MAENAFAEGDGPYSTFAAVGLSVIHDILILSWPTCDICTCKAQTNVLIRLLKLKIDA